MTTNRFFLSFAISLFFLPEMAIAMPGSGVDVLLDAQARALLQAEFEALGVTIRPPLPGRPRAYRRSFSEPALLVPEPGEQTPPVRRKHKRKKLPPAERPVESAPEIQIEAQPKLTEPDAEASEVRTLHLRRQKLKRALSHRHLANEDTNDLFDLTTALFASQIDAPLETFLREPNEVKTRFFQILREQQFVGHRLGRFMLFHVRFEKLILSAFLKAVKSEDDQQMSRNFATEILAQVEKVSINEETTLALNRLLELATQKIDESNQDLSMEQRQLLARKMVINALGLYLLGPVALESGAQNAVVRFRNIMATLAYDPDNTDETDQEAKAHWDAWLELLEHLLSDLSRL